MNGLIDPGVALYVSAAVALLVWAGIFAYLWRIDAQARALAKALERLPEHPAPGAAPAAPLRPERQSPAPKEVRDAER
ncbi:MAG TPA: hypothetical protein VGE07_22975 [Herpetosiphonaceae bacterium]